MASENLYSAAEQALGYVYQIRFALLQTFKLNENTVCFIEKDDDIDFSDPEEGKILASLKHKGITHSVKSNYNEQQLKGMLVNMKGTLHFIISTKKLS